MVERNIYIYIFIFDEFNFKSNIVFFFYLRVPRDSKFDRTLYIYMYISFQDIFLRAEMRMRRKEKEGSFPFLRRAMLAILDKRKKK